ncbi:23S rRNA (pseudouridine(1915)-N(3))-methyltransferase RlmH [Stomatobaculum longum]|jgi:rRNA large subunit m3Psi methyltransferase rlmH|uniref:23S rRNA (pseudouridine(1915)-N(3))-methyltransferase RlmH n=1 Tax=Stomatobaculum longum TaxID=796942 RepID=UPI0028F05533|nr:23S rRNA (pseudouridine(1915)-N(3))-methyltransferase RlmH [Stomatobaculum longum]
MNVTLLTVGSLKERYWREAVAEYEKRLSAYCKFRLIEVKDEKTPDAIDSAASRRVRQKEGERLLERIDARALVVTLEIQGKKFDSEGFAAEMEKLEERSRGELCFVIGGSLGLSPEVSARAALHLSFSDFTFPHQLMRVLFLEQLYRSYRIRTGAPYHK